MSLRAADVLVIGGGIAGASVAARLGGAARVTILEMEERPGFHSTGRSAAMYEPTYGPPMIRALTRASGPFFHVPPDGFAAAPLVAERGVLLAGEAGDEAALAEALDTGFIPISADEAKRRMPLLRLERMIGFLWDAETKDVDVDLLHQGFLKQHRRAGGEVVCNAAVVSARRQARAWQVETHAGTFAAPVVVIAAGAWSDAVAGLFGARGLGLQPKRRSAALIPPPPGLDISAWPQFFPAREDFYTKPVGGLLMMSPADADPVDPHDAFADDMRLAEGAAAFERVLYWQVTRIERSWGGLRTFASDGEPVVGYDPEIEGLFWLAGQGGYGIQTSPALSEAAAALILRRPLPPHVTAEGVTADAISPARFRAVMRA